MIQELATDSGAGAWAIGSLLFFITVYLVIAVRLYRARPEDLAAQARLVLDDGDEKAGADHGGV
ncbi:MAG: hypothetical protein ABI665_11595 [Vicinamibacterales bacterium]